MPPVLRSGPYRFYFYSHNRTSLLTSMWTGMNYRQSIGWTRLPWRVILALLRMNSA